MEDSQNYVYILFSATPYRMGRCIRFVTGESYNHVSIAMEEDLTRLYAFARRYYCTPFYGGFVTEHPERYCHNGTAARILLCRLPVSEDKLEQLTQRLEKMDSRSHKYLYNHFSALAAPMHWKIPVNDAYTCAEFAVSVLSSIGYDFNPRLFYSIGDIAEKLKDYQIYAGEFPMPAKAARSRFFDPAPVPHPMLACTKDILRLMWRMTLQGRRYFRRWYAVSK